MEDRKKTLIFFNAAFLNTPSQFFHCHLSPPKFAFYETLSKLKLDWMFAAEKNFIQHSGSPVVPKLKDACSQSFGTTGIIFRTSGLPEIERTSFQIYH